jgi:hypothetical protein
MALSFELLEFAPRPVSGGEPYFLLDCCEDPGSTSLDVLFAVIVSVLDERLVFRNATLSVVALERESDS